MTSKSLTDYAFDVLSESKQESMTFQDIFKAVLEKAGDTNLDEQEVIVKYLDNKCQEIEKSIEKRNRLIKNLQEYKKALIYEVVTGKKEV